MFRRFYVSSFYFDKDEASVFIYYEVNFAPPSPKVLADDFSVDDTSNKLKPSVQDWVTTLISIKYNFFK